MSKVTRAVMEANTGHRLVAATFGNERFIIARMRCGAWMTAQPRRLLQECQGRMAEGTKRERNKIAAGWHPKLKGVPLEGLVALTPGAEQMD